MVIGLVVWICDKALPKSRLHTIVNIRGKIIAVTFKIVI